MFVTPDGQYEFVRMPFGEMKKILERLSGADHQEQVRSFLGLVDYTRDHLQAFAEVSAVQPPQERTSTME